MRILAALLLVGSTLCKAQAFLHGSPDPFTPNDQGLGQIELSWSAPGAASIEIRIGSPNGALFTRYLASGTAETGWWVTEGLAFYLQDVSGGEPGSTVATFIAHADRAGLPGAYLVSTNNGRALAYSAPGASQIEIHLNKPWGPLLAHLAGGLGTAPVGEWVRDGMRFFLQDVSSGQPLTAENTLASAVVTVEPSVTPQADIVFGALPGVVADPDNTGLGATTLFWSAPAKPLLEVHVNAPDGPLFARSTSTGAGVTANWVTDGMRFYLQDASGMGPSEGRTLAIATVDLQPSRQRYLAYYKEGAGVVTYSGNSLHLLGSVYPEAFPAGVTLWDMHASLDGALLYALGSDSEYYVIDPSSDQITNHFAAAASGKTFGVFAGASGETLLATAPDTSGAVAIVGAQDGALVAALTCSCYGSVSGMMINPTTRTPVFVTVAPAGAPPLRPPVLGLSGLVAYAITPDLQLSSPYPLPLPPTWTASTVNAGESMLMLNAGAGGTLLVAWSQLQTLLLPPRPSDVVAYDLETRAMTLLTANFTVDGNVYVPEAAAPDGLSVYAQPRLIEGVAPDQRGTLLPGPLSVFVAGKASPLSFSLGGTLMIPIQSGQSTVDLVTPPLGVDEASIFFGQVTLLGGSDMPWSSRPAGPFTLSRADRNTLTANSPTRITIDTAPTGSWPTPITGLSFGAYQWKAAPKSFR